MRYNAEIKEYNNAAKELMNNLGVKINDLYSIAKALTSLIMQIGLIRMKKVQKYLQMQSLRVWKGV